MAKHLSKEFTFFSHLGKIAKALRIEGLDREGGDKCQLSIKILAIYQFSVRFKVICQLNDC